MMLGQLICSLLDPLRHHSHKTQTSPPTKARRWHWVNSSTACLTHGGTISTKTKQVLRSHTAQKLTGSKPKDDMEAPYQQKQVLTSKPEDDMEVSYWNQNKSSDQSQKMTLRHHINKTKRSPQIKVGKQTWNKGAMGTILTKLNSQENGQYKSPKNHSQNYQNQSCTDIEALQKLTRSNSAMETILTKLNSKENGQ